MGRDVSRLKTVACKHVLETDGSLKLCIPMLSGLVMLSHLWQRCSPNSVHTGGVLAACLRYWWSLGGGAGCAVPAHFCCYLSQTVRVTLKFSRRNGRFFHLHQKNTMVLTHFSSQRLPWPPSPDCSQMGSKWFPYRSQIAPKWLPDCSQIAPCSLMTSMIPRG